MKNLLHVREVAKILGVSKTTVYRLIKFKQFPTPINITEGRVGWLESEVEKWIDSRIKATREA